MKANRLNESFLGFLRHHFHDNASGVDGLDDCMVPFDFCRIEIVLGNAPRRACYRYPHPHAYNPAREQRNPGQASRAALHEIRYSFQPTHPLANQYANSLVTENIVNILCCCKHIFAKIESVS